VTPRLVIREEVPEERVAQIAQELDWTEGELAAPTDPGFYERVWQTPDGLSVVHYLQDGNIGAHYLLVQGANPPELEERIREAFPLYTRDEVLELADSASSRREKVRAVCRLGATAPAACDRDYLDRHLRFLLEDDDPEVRAASLFATTYPHWIEFREPIERMAAEDPDEDTRLDAQDTLEALERHHWGGEGS
jgi:hypothetical protein